MLQGFTTAWRRIDRASDTPDFALRLQAKPAFSSQQVANTPKFLVYAFQSMHVPPCMGLAALAWHLPHFFPPRGLSSGLLRKGRGCHQQQQQPTCADL